MNRDYKSSRFQQFLKYSMGYRTESSMQFVEIAGFNISSNYGLWRYSVSSWMPSITKHEQCILHGYKSHATKIA